MPRIECEYDPNEFISIIGDRFFTLCDENMDDEYRHPDHPNTIRLMDCEDGVWIDISTEHGDVFTMQSAKALLKLLNQEYKCLE